MREAVTEVLATTNVPINVEHFILIRVTVDVAHYPTFRMDRVFSDIRGGQGRRVTLIAFLKAMPVGVIPRCQVLTPNLSVLVLNT